MKKILSLFLILTMLSTPAYSRYIPGVLSETYNSKGLFERLKGKSIEGCEIIDVIYHYKHKRYDSINEMYANIICVKDGELNNIKILIYPLIKENGGLFSSRVFNKEIKQLLGEN